MRWINDIARNDQHCGRFLTFEPEDKKSLTSPAKMGDESERRPFNVLRNSASCQSISNIFLILLSQPVIESLIILGNLAWSGNT